MAKESQNRQNAEQNTGRQDFGSFVWQENAAPGGRWQAEGNHHQYVEMLCVSYRITPEHETDTV